MGLKSVATMRQAVALQRRGSSPTEVRAYLDSRDFGGLHISTAAKIGLGVVAAGTLALPGVISAVAPVLQTLRPVATPQLQPNLAALIPGAIPAPGHLVQQFSGAPSLPQATRPGNMSILGKIGSAVGGYLAGGVGGAVGALMPSQPALSANLCPDGSRKVLGRCMDLMPGGAVSGGGVVLNYGEAVMARYGSGLVPASRALTVRRCPRGAVLGNDGVCYNRSSLNRRDRMWVPGRKPLLTGGDLNAITKAHRAATKIKAQTKRLQAMGMLAKPKAGRGRARAPGAGAVPGFIALNQD